MSGPQKRPERRSMNAHASSGGSDRWICKICGYIYDPAMHEGVRFEDLADDWLCPGCGFGKDFFKLMPMGDVGDMSLQ